MQVSTTPRTDIEIALFLILGRHNLRAITPNLLKNLSGKWVGRVGFGGAPLAATLYATGAKINPEVKSEISEFGLYYDDGNMHFALGVFKRPVDGKFCLHIIAPHGDRLPEKLTKLTSRIQRYLPENEVYVRYLSASTVSSLEKFGWVDSSKKPWIPEAHSEDEFYPQRIVDLRDAYSKNTHGKLRAVENVIRKRGLIYTLRPLEDYGLAIDMIEQHFSILNNPIGSTADDYRALIKGAIALNGAEGVYTYMGNLNEKPVSVFIGQEYERGKLGLYANITLRQEFHNLPLYAHNRLFEELQSCGITHVNLGGSETASLDSNKAHLAKATQPSFWATRG